MITFIRFALVPILVLILWKFGHSMHPYLLIGLYVLLFALTASVIFQVLWTLISNPALAAVIFLGGGLTIGLFWIFLVFFVANFGNKSALTRVHPNEATPTFSPAESATTTSSTPIEVAPQTFPRAAPAAPNASESYVATATPAPATYQVIGIRTGDYLNVREAAGSNYPVVTRLEPGTSGIVLGTKRVANGATTWQEISVHGHGGWVNAEYIALETKAPASPQ